MVVLALTLTSVLAISGLIGILVYLINELLTAREEGYDIKACALCIALEFVVLIAVFASVFWEI